MFSKTVRLIESHFYLVNTIEIKQNNLSKMRSYGTLNRDNIKKIQTVRLIETVLIIES